MPLPSNMIDAFQMAEKMNAEVDEWRKGIEKKPEKQHGTMAYLVYLYIKDDSFTELADSTRKEYARQLDAIISWTKKNRQIKAITPKAVKQWYLSERENHGIRQSKYRIQVLRRLMNFAISEGLAERNPCVGLRMRHQKPRKIVWEQKDIDALLKVADPVVRRATLLALYTGQRVADVLKMTYRDYDGHVIKVHQNKTKARLQVSVSPELRDELSTKLGDSIFMIPTHRGTPFKVSSFGKVFAEVREKAGISKEYQFRDLRRTAVVRLFRAGCSPAEVASVTGHDINESLQILDWYFPKDAEVARNAITKLEDYRKKVGTP